MPQRVKCKAEAVAMQPRLEVNPRIVYACAIVRAVFLVFYIYSNLTYVQIHVIYRNNRAEYVIRISMAASRQHVNTYSIRWVLMSKV